MNGYTAEQRRRPRYKAWRNVIVASVNAGIKSGRMSLDTEGDVDPSPLVFQLSDGMNIATVFYCNQCPWSEISVTAWVNPINGNLPEAGVAYGMPRSDLADCTAQGWIERRNGKWIQDGVLFRCRRSLIKPLSEVHIEPDGFLDHGRFYL